MTDLQPCPFCGSTNLYYEYERPQGYICCSKCGAEGPRDGGTSDETGRLAWNRRAALAEPEPQRRCIYNPVQIAECGGPCEQGPEHCDCGELWVTESEPERPTDDELDELFTEIDQSGEPESWRAYARAVLARWGK